MRKVKIKIGDLFGSLSFDNENFEKLQEYDKDIFIKDQKGNLTKILGFVKKDKLPMVGVETESGKKVVCSTKHKFKIGNEDVFAIDANEIETTDGREKILKKTHINHRRYAYDISVPSPHYYQDASGIIHHNTTVAKVLCREISPGDHLYINASDENSVDTVRVKITEFCSTVSWVGGKKIIVLDEFDGMSAAAQKMLRNTMEKFYKNVSFILTANYENQIIDPIKSRCQKYSFGENGPVEIAKRCLNILKEEGIECDDCKKNIQKLVKAFYPDVRSIIQNLQRFTSGGEFNYIEKAQTGQNEKKEKLMAYLKAGNIKAINKELCGLGADYIGYYEYLFENAAEFSDGDEIFTNMLIIADYLKDHVIVPNVQINFTACLIRLCGAE